MIERAAIKEIIDSQRKDKIPMEHYMAHLKDYDPLEMARKSTCPYDEQRHCFTVNVMDDWYEVSYPEGIITHKGAAPCEDMHLMTLILRYLENAREMAPTGKNINYRDVPGGNHYYKTFEGRCIKRLAFSFGNDLEKFEAVMQQTKSERVHYGDLAYRFCFMGNRYVTAILWMGDDEFPPQAQILFDENITAAFDAEDMAVVGDVFIGWLKNKQ